MENQLVLRVHKLSAEMCRLLQEPFVVPIDEIRAKTCTGKTFNISM